MPRVAVLRHQLGVPSETFVLEQARSFGRWEPVLVARDQPPAHLEAGVPVVSLARRGGALAAAAHAAGAAGPLTALLRELRADAVLAHFGVEGAHALPAARRAGLPLATVFHGFDATCTRAALLRARRASWVTYARRLPRLARQGELFLPVSAHLRARLLERGFPAARTAVHHLGLDLAKVPAALPGAVPAADPRTVVHVARLVPKKGTAHLLRAAALLTARGVDVRLVCVGDGPLRAPLEQLARDLGLGGRAVFTGALPNAEVLARVAAAAVLCLPSVTAPSGDQEGLGQVLLEAGALGRPVVATAHGGIPDAVRDGVTGTLVPEADPVALAAALERYLRDPALAARTGAAARAHVSARFDVRARTRLLEERLDALAAAARGGAR
ncbi:glycosyltransferase [Kineococcus indalonis]|uniref:glycosyltransferase n=1 Tax=Kineococcus indalonis TaxID=2696566 RepID=UPI0014123F0A|nr:glycosyltransferase [Kineococcus indalonis]NAZ88194.1 glycosyltransferase [Kineococcus indalonis]